MLKTLEMIVDFRRKKQKQFETYRVSCNFSCLKNVLRIITHNLHNKTLSWRDTILQISSPTPVKTHLNLLDAGVGTELKSVGRSLGKVLETPSFVCNLKLKTINIKRLQSLVSLLQWCRDPGTGV